MKSAGPARGWRFLTIMRYVWITFIALVGLLLGFFAWPRFSLKTPAKVGGPAAPVRPAAWVGDQRPTSRADSVVSFAMHQLGTGYCYAGATPATGFDCSGFVRYVFSNFRVAVPHSTALLIDVGHPIPRERAYRGDIVVFTGTEATSTMPGHAGIVVSEPGQPLRFIHSSSARREPGVKISQVEGTDYERRFMQVRRVLLR
jgi:cell wall-associated NlpC family hydrolase